MSLSHIDCYFYCPDERSENASCVAVNPSFEPGSLVFAGAAAARESISGQVACKLALEHFVSGVLDFCERQPRGSPESVDSELSTEILEAAFKNANTSVYNFGHRLAAAGRMAASLLGLVVRDTCVAAGRAGTGTAYLFRGGELFPFFERRAAAAGEVEREKMVGAHSLVAVELASVPVAEGDWLAAFSHSLDEEREQQLAILLAELASEGATSFGVADIVRIGRRLFQEPGSLNFALVAHIGPETIYLHHPLGRGL